MLVPLSVEDSRRLLAFFEEAGYTETVIRKRLVNAELLSSNLRNEARLLDRTADPTLLNVLLRWFWLRRAETEAKAAELVPEEFLRLLFESGLLRSLDGRLAGRCMVLPTDGFLVVADYPVAIEREQSEMVLWPNPTSRLLSRFTIRRHSRSTLDLGTGSGILSLGAARHSDEVVATDLNERALVFAKFNARLNGIENIQMLGGDCFAPVANRSFDLILSNPPFFITPQKGYLFCDNPMELDGLCRRLVKEAPAHLNEDGYLEMLCEWAEVEGQPWQERIAEWFQGTGCDAWVMKGMTQDPGDYAQQRIREVNPDAQDDANFFDGYMTYYRERGVKAIHDGFIVMRRRSGANWVRIEEVPVTPKGDLGAMVLSTFEAEDILSRLKNDEALLTTKPRLSPHARLEQVCAQGEGRWVAESLTLRLVSGFPFHTAMQPLVAEFLVACDGTRTAEQAIEAFARTQDAPYETVRRESLDMLRKLIGRGFMVVPNG